MLSIPGDQKILIIRNHFAPKESVKEFKVEKVIKHAYSTKYMTCIDLYQNTTFLKITLSLDKKRNKNLD